MTHIRLLIAVVACLVLNIGAAAAGESADGFLSEMLATEFNTGYPARLRHVIFSDGKGDTVGDCDCSEQRELFDASGDPVVVVSDWRIAGADRKTPKGTVVPVRFLVLANSEWETPYRSDGAFDVKYVPLHEPRWEEVNYLLRYRKGHWFVVDPPLPRVGIEPLIQAVHSRLDQETEVLDMPKLTEFVREAHQRALAHRQRQLSVLEPLRLKHGGGSSTPSP